MADAMEELSLSKIKEIGGVDIDNLTKLNASKQNLGSVCNLSACTYLERLDLSQNALMSLKGIACCSNLKWLNVSNNRLSSLSDVKALHDLVVLNAGHNGLKSTQGLERMTNLKALVLNDNHISSVEEMDSLTSLNALVLSHNKLKVANVDKFVGLTKLSLSHNRLKEIPSIKKNKKLKELRLNDNKIKSIPAEIRLTTWLVLLDLGNNRIKEFRDVEALGKLTYLKNLNLKGNPLCSLEGYKDKIIQLIPSLDVLDGKKLGYFESHFQQLLVNPKGMQDFALWFGATTCSWCGKAISPAIPALLFEYKKKSTKTSFSEKDPSDEKNITKTTKTKKISGKETTAEDEGEKCLATEADSGYEIAALKSKGEKQNDRKLKQHGKAKGHRVEKSTVVESSFEKETQELHSGHSSFEISRKKKKKKSHSHTDRNGIHDGTSPLITSSESKNTLESETVVSGILHEKKESGIKLDAGVQKGSKRKIRLEVSDESETGIGQAAIMSSKLDDEPPPKLKKKETKKNETKLAKGQSAVGNPRSAVVAIKSYKKCHRNKKEALKPREVKTMLTSLSADEIGAGSQCTW